MTLPQDVLAQLASPLAASCAHARPLHDAAASRQVEQTALSRSPPHSLMARAGLAVAKMALAIAPQARQIWVLAGPGNNGGDGWVAARWLHQTGRRVRVLHVPPKGQAPADALWAQREALAAGVQPCSFADLDDTRSSPPDLIIDALLGLGSDRPPEGALLRAIQRCRQATCPVLAVDLPTGLAGESGAVLGDVAVRADHTLSLLTLKPGLFTGQGRDHAGRIWLDTLGCDDLLTASASAWLGCPGLHNGHLPRRQHAQHKGSFGDVLVIGGAPGMGGAALLAARAALAAGAGRVMVARLDGHVDPDPMRPECMPRSLDESVVPEMLAASTVVCGCGGGTGVQAILPQVLIHAHKLVLDADGLNAVARDAQLDHLLASRATRGLATVLTPHPLEAARLLGCTVAQVQADRLAQAQALSVRTGCTVVLKGSGTVIASAGLAPLINPTGNARLGSGGTGDVLAGWLGGIWSPLPAQLARQASAQAVWTHGLAAEGGDDSLPLLASDLIQILARGAGHAD